MMLGSWPPKLIGNELGIATLSLGSWKYHRLPERLRQAAHAGFKVIDLFDEDWAEYLHAHGLNSEQLWEPTEANLKVAKELSDLIRSLGMRIACTQPAREVEGIKDPTKRRASLSLVAKRFPFMRAFDTDLVFMCSNIRADEDITSDFQVVAKDLAELGDMAKDFSLADGGKMLRIGYEGLSWAVRNTWSSSWEVVRAANKPNVGLMIDSFNMLAVEYADPYNPEGHGRIYSTSEESIDVLSQSLASLIATVPGHRIFFVQLGDAELVDPAVFLPPSDPKVPRLLPWSRNHRLYPMEHDRGGYMPVELVVAAVLATGYEGPLSLEVFNASLNSDSDSVPLEHARRGYTGLRRLLDVIPDVPRFWSPNMSTSK